MNSVQLLGRLTKDPELRVNSSSTTAMVRFSIAVDKQLSREKKEELESNNKPTADFINCIAWGGTAEAIAKYTAKGNRILVQGRIQTGSYQADDGSKRYTTDIVIASVDFIDWKDTQESSDDYTPSNDDRIPF